MNASVFNFIAKSQSGIEFSQDMSFIYRRANTTFKPTRLRRAAYLGRWAVKMKTKTIAAIVALLALSFRPAFAISFKDAAENLLYFEYAALSADYCERLGYPSRSLFSTWKQKYAHMQNESVKRILAEGESRGLAKSEQGQVLSEAIENQRKLASDSIAKNGVPCAKYRAFLDGYHQLLKK